MAKIISFLNQKGGVGKTTLSSNIATAIASSSVKVLLVDADPQGSLRDWNDANNGKFIPVIGLDRETLPKDIMGIKQSYDYIIIDGAPQSSKLAAAATKASDLVIIPVTPSPYDVWACSDLIDILQARQLATDGAPIIRFLISRARKGTKLTQDVKEALSGYNIPILNNRTIHREVYAKTASDGLTVLQSKNIEAIEEINEIKNEILSLI